MTSKTGLMTVKASQFKNSQRLKDFQLAIKSTLWGEKKGKKVVIPSLRDMKLAFIYRQRFK